MKKMVTGVLALVMVLVMVGMSSTLETAMISALVHG